MGRLAGVETAIRIGKIDSICAILIGGGRWKAPTFAWCAALVYTLTTPASKPGAAVPFELPVAGGGMRPRARPAPERGCGTVGESFKSASNRCAFPSSEGANFAQRTRVSMHWLARASSAVHHLQHTEPSIPDGTRPIGGEPLGHL